MKKLWTLIAGMALVMSSCSDDTTEPAGPVGTDDLATLTEITATLPTTRAALGEHDFEEALQQGISIKTLWAEGDYISIWSKEDRDRVVLYHLKSGAGTETATFEVDAADGLGVVGKTFYALYNGSDSPSKQITVKELQGNNEKYPESNIAEGAAPMAATFTAESGQLSRVNFAFKNLCGIMAVTVAPDEDVTLSNITLTSTTNLSGTGNLALSTENPNQLVFNIASSASKTISRELGNYQVAAGERPTFYFVVPVGNYGLLKIDVMSSISLEPVWSRQRTIAGAGLSIAPGGITRIANINLKMAAPHAYNVGDVYPNGATGDAVEGVVYQADDNGLKGKIVSLKNCTIGGSPYESSMGISYSVYEWTTNSTTSAWPTDANNGLANLTKVEATLSAYPAINACAQLGEGWYLPARTELNTLMDAAGSNVDDAISANGGHTLMDGDAYWSSSSARGSIFYYSYDENALGAIRSCKFAAQSDVSGAARAIKQFESK